MSTQQDEQTAMDGALQNEDDGALIALGYQFLWDDWAEECPEALIDSFRAEPFDGPAHDRGLLAADYLREVYGTPAYPGSNFPEIDEAMAEVREANDETSAIDPEGFRYRGAVIQFISDREAERREGLAHDPCCTGGDMGSLPVDENKPRHWMLDFIRDSNERYQAGIERFAANLRKADRVRFPPDLLRVEGLLGQFIAECERSAPERRQPVYALAAAVCVVGALAGRRYCSDTDLRTNLYCAILGESSSGKGHSQKVATRLLRDAGLTRYLAGDFASGSGLDTDLVRHPALLAIVDEFGIWLSGLTGPRAPKHLVDIRKRLMTLFSSAGEFVIGNAYADAKLRPRMDIFQPHLCFLGAGTPGHFFTALQSGALTDGFIPRFLIFQPDEFYPPVVNNPKPLRIPVEMILAAQRIAGADPSSGNLAAVLEMQHGEEYPATEVPFSRDGRAEQDRRRAKREAIIQGGCKGFVSRELVGKWGEHAIKLAMVRAISRDPVKPIMDETCVAWGWRVAEWCIRSVNGMAEKHLADSPHEANYKYVRGIIAEAGATGLMKRDLIRKTTRLDLKTLEHVIHYLLETGDVFGTKDKPGPKGGRPGLHYRINDRREV